MAPKEEQRTIQNLFSLSARWSGSAEIFADDMDRLDGAQSLDAVATLAGALKAQGVSKGDRVVFLCGSSVRHALAFFACQWLGAVACVLHARDTESRLAMMLDWLETDLLLADPEYMPLAGRICDASERRPRFASMGDSTPAGATGGWSAMMAAPALPEPARVKGDDPALIILSSGTTGEPKGVVHTQASLFSGAVRGTYVYGIADPGESTIVVMSPSFAAWTIVSLPYIAVRGRIVYGRSFDPAGFVETIAAEQVTMASLVPTMWRMVLATDPDPAKFASLERVFFSGEPGTPDLVRAMAERVCPHVRTAYCSSEAGSGSAVVAGPQTLLAGGKAASTGRPVPGADMRIVDPDGPIDRQLSVGEIGEICVRSPSVAARYWKDEKRTAEKFVEGWWRSGDLGRVDDDGDLYVVGRTDNVINSGGVKVHAEEIEAALTRHPGIALAAVIGQPDERWGQRIEAHMVAKGTPPSPEELDRFCREDSGLPGFKVPKRFVFHEALPTGPTGKLYRRGLRLDD